MRRFIYNTIVYAAVLITATWAQAQEPAFEMIEPSNLGSVSVSGDVTAADVNNWPATLVFRFSIGGGSYACTSTVIGPRTILTAAHCVGNGNSGKVRIGSTTYSVTCTIHDSYTATGGGRVYDIALCSTAAGDADIALQRGSRRYESINTDNALIRADRAVTLLGYGCLGVVGDNPGHVLYQGPTVIDRISGVDIVTTEGATVCPGDSGGGAYIATGAERRRVAAINSRVGITNGQMNSTSRLTNLTHASIAQFISSWASDRNAQICGLNLSGPKCRP